MFFIKDDILKKMTILFSPLFKIHNVEYCTIFKMSLLKEAKTNTCSVSKLNFQNKHFCFVVCSFMDTNVFHLMQGSRKVFITDNELESLFLNLCCALAFRSLLIERLFIGVNIKFVSGMGLNKHWSKIKMKKSVVCF